MELCTQRHVSPSRSHGAAQGHCIAGETASLSMCIDVPGDVEIPCQVPALYLGATNLIPIFVLDGAG